MLFRLSQKLGAKIKAGKLVQAPLHADPLLDWSAQSFAVGRTQYILLSNTKSLFSTILLAKGCTDLPRFIERAVSGIRECLEAHGDERVFRDFIAPHAGIVRFAKALNRSVTGSMNEQIRCAGFCMVDGDLSLLELGQRLNDNLLSAIASSGSTFGRPRDAFRELVGATLKPGNS